MRMTIRMILLGGILMMVDPNDLCGDVCTGCGKELTKIEMANKIVAICFEMNCRTGINYIKEKEVDPNER